MSPPDARIDEAARDDAALEAALADQASVIRDRAALRQVYAQPSERAVQKQLPRLDKHCRAFIAISPFVVVATAGSDGRMDCSPRGDQPGFVQVHGERTLLLPDRVGNNRLDSIQNLLDNPRIGLLFVVPGMNETLRVNGRARLSVAPALLDRFVVSNAKPRSVIVVEVEEAYMHCARSFLRARLWDAKAQIDRKSFPTLGQILADQVAGVEAEATDKYLAHSNANLY